MEGIDALNQGLYFSATQAVASKAAKEAKSSQKTSKTKKGVFASAMEKLQVENQLLEEGLPIELAGMEPEEAVVFLKDAADLAAEELKNNQMPEQFADYRKKVSQFMRYIVKTNYTIKRRERTGRNRLGKPIPPQTQIIMVNQKLDEIAQWLLHSHSDTLQMLAKLDEIKGLLVDLMAT